MYEGRRHYKTRVANNCKSYRAKATNLLGHTQASKFFLWLHYTLITRYLRKIMRRRDEVRQTLYGDILVLLAGVLAGIDDANLLITLIDR
ncbi:hypothetical protein K449DRAFT_42467 [Hypoxylon sp. EC38]|nr:hypothetical protein K449DRAFT_42467 [Hypoxylon sp. EC38]